MDINREEIIQGPINEDEGTKDNDGETSKIPDGYIRPEGTIQITKNGEYDVTSYEKANVNVITDKKYTEVEYQDYGNNRYNMGYAAGAKATTGQKVYWDKITVNFPTNNSSKMTVTLDYIPSFIFIKATNKMGDMFHVYTYDSGRTFYANNCSNNTSAIVNYWKLSSNNLTLTVTNVDNYKGVPFDIYTMR